MIFSVRDLFNTCSLVQKHLLGFESFIYILLAVVEEQHRDIKHNNLIPLQLQELLHRLWRDKFVFFILPRYAKLNVQISLCRCTVVNNWSHFIQTIFCLRKFDIFCLHSSQAARSALLSYEDVSQMLSDLRKIDFGQILSKSFFISGNSEIFHKAKTCKWPAVGMFFKLLWILALFLSNSMVDFNVNTSSRLSLCAVLLPQNACSISFCGIF